MREDSPAARTSPAIALWLIRFAALWSGRQGIPANGNHFSHDGDSYLFRGQSANIQSDGGMDAREFLGRKAFSFQNFLEFDQLALASNHADVSRGGSKCPPQAGEICFMSAGCNDQVGEFIRLKLRENRLPGAGVGFSSGRETLFIGKGFPIVADNHIKSGYFGNFVDRTRNVSATKKVKGGCCENRLNKDIE